LEEIKKKKSLRIAEKRMKNRINPDSCSLELMVLKT